MQSCLRRDRDWTAEQQGCRGREGSAPLLGPPGKQKEREATLANSIINAKRLRSLSLLYKWERNSPMIASLKTLWPQTKNSPGLDISVPPKSGGGGDLYPRRWGPFFFPWNFDWDILAYGWGAFSVGEKKFQWHRCCGNWGGPRSEP
jgi:hypothetical protein